MTALGDPPTPPTESDHDGDDGGGADRRRGAGRGRTSGIEFDQTVFHLWTFRDGMPWRCEVFIDEDAAQQAAGLSE